MLRNNNSKKQDGRLTVKPSPFARTLEKWENSKWGHFRKIFRYFMHITMLYPGNIVKKLTNTPKVTYRSKTKVSSFWPTKGARATSLAFFICWMNTNLQDPYLMSYHHVNNFFRLQKGTFRLQKGCIPLCNLTLLNKK